MKIRVIILSFLMIFLGQNLHSQRLYSISKENVELDIDGLLNEEIWNTTEVADKFTVNSPQFGEISKFESEVHMFYDDNAIYFGGKMIDPNPDSVSYTLSQRDDTGNADWFGVSLNPMGIM